MQSHERTDREIQAIFGTNLRILMEGQPSVTAVCREIGVNRTQFNRYLNGDVTPRPIILTRICKYFDVDARVLTTPLDEIKSDQSADPFSLLLNGHAHLPEPPHQQLLPDGLYAEWKMSMHNKDHVNFHIIQITTENDQRVTRVKCRDFFNPQIPGLKRHTRRIDYKGRVLSQLNGFYTIDTPEDGDILTLTSYRFGFHVKDNIFPGIKLSAVSYSAQMTHSCTPCFLEKLPADFPGRLAIARTPYQQPIDEAPAYVGGVLRAVVKSGMALPTL